jgi:hypothetical protein
MEERKLFEEAHRRYWDELESRRGTSSIPLSYAAVEEVRKGKWLPFIDMMVSDELRETINLMNAWRGQLFAWSIWATILPTFEEYDRWSVQMQQVDPLAFACMFQASAMRDRLCMIVTNAIHQANLVALPGHKDSLEQDERFLRRFEKEKQLERLGRTWTTFGQFRKDLVSINTADYRQETRNFRNQSSHAIAPRFEVGYTNTVMRYRTPSEKMVLQPDGSYSLVRHPSRMVVAYGFGGTPPLKNQEMVTATEKQHGLAAGALAAYEVLLREMLGVIGTQRDETAEASNSGE